jgi:flavin-dependent dehydrogenase
MYLARCPRLEVVVFERKESLAPKPCGGGLGPMALDELRRADLLETIADKAWPVRGLRLSTPRGRRAEVAGPDTSTLVVERHEIDQLLAARAESAGAKVERGMAVKKICRVEGRAQGVYVSGGFVEADLVLVAAGGTTSLHPPTPKRLVAVSRKVDGGEYAAGLIEMALHPSVAPWYAWVFPEPGGRRANVGLCCSAGLHPPRELSRLLDRVLEERFSHCLKGASTIETRHASIRCSLWPRRFATPGAWVLGEAAGMASWATGEGIAQAMRSGRICAEAASFLPQIGEPSCRQLYRARACAGIGPSLISAPGIQALASGYAAEALAHAAHTALSAQLSRAAARLIAPG